MEIDINSIQRHHDQFMELVNKNKDLLFLCYKCNSPGIRDRTGMLDKACDKYLCNECFHKLCIKERERLKYTDNLSI